MPDTGARFDPLDAVLFDLDGVLTPTAEAHMRACARLFEPSLAGHGAAPLFTAVLATAGVVPYPGSVAFFDALAERGGVAGRLRRRSEGKR